jgi:hypothetical protein
MPSRSTRVAPIVTVEALADGGSDAIIDALVAYGDAATVAARLIEHLDSGA